ncbi:hypothetical protein VKT23_013494 [Stygiomarasmius scandens]|uniref:F-box domain-containing protein n=1 Tax=Marasmiellus scandens TaxID=2682957 RepID=A0ABR1J558_9AGAR
MLLSAELIDSVIDLVDDSHALKRCSLVSRVWRPHSQYQLFSTTLNLISPPVQRNLGSSSIKPEQILKYARDFIEIAYSSPTISSAVRRLIIPLDALRQFDSETCKCWRSYSSWKKALEENTRGI